MMKKWLTLTVILIVIVTVTFTPVIQAYEFLGGSWTDSDVQALGWSIENYDWRGWDVRYYFSKAADSWNHVAGYKIPYFYEVNSGEKILVKGYYEESNVLAYVRLYPDRWTHPYTYAKVYINVYWFDVGYYEGGEHFQFVCAHELGHVIGLDHESDYGPIILMWENDLPYLDCGIHTPQWDDVQGVKALYGG